MFRALHPFAIILGVAGVIPFALMGLFSVGADPLSSLSAVRGLIGYGAVILAFLGGVHWGFTLSEDGDPRSVRARLSLGVLPSLIGWGAILCSVVSRPVFSVALLIAGMIGTVVVESRAQKRDMMPAGYMALRWVLTVVVVLILSTVLVLRVVGGHILM